MEANYNFILTELLLNSDDKEFIDGFIKEFVNKVVTLEVEFLDDKLLANEPYAELKKNLDKAHETNQLKLKCVKAQDFEGAAAYRNTERELLAQLEKDGFNLYKLDHNEFALYHVDVDKKGRKLKFIVYTNSKECIRLLT